MKNSSNKILLERTFRFFLICVIFFSTFCLRVNNIQAESFFDVDFPKESIVEHLKLDVPKEFRKAWLKAEERSWEPWLLKQDGFLGRQMFWDPKSEEATLLIGWESKAAWKNIPQIEINLVQQDFEQDARKATGQSSGNPFPLIYEGELYPE